LGKGPVGRVGKYGAPASRGRWPSRHRNGMFTWNVSQSHRTLNSLLTGVFVMLWWCRWVMRPMPATKKNTGQTRDSERKKIVCDKPSHW
jgi:hypothetical protein